MQSQVSIWYGAVLRGDLNNIRVGAYSNIQDKSIIHAARSAVVNVAVIPCWKRLCATLPCIVLLLLSMTIDVFVSGLLPQDCPQQPKLAGM